MIYSNPEFIALFALTLAAYSLAGSYRVRFTVLLGASVVFYAAAGLFDSLVFLGVIAVSWSAAALSQAFPAARRWSVSAGITLLVAHLFFWKYAPWAVSQAQRAAPGLLGGRKLYFPLPLGISFFTLQSVAYLIDLSRGQAEFVGFRVYALFKSFFAQLLAGPIVRGSQLLPQLERLERPRPRDVSLGLSLFVLGFFKKVCVADRMGFFVDAVFAAPERFGRLILIKALLGYAVQVWADFSGYTDMGRGAALMLGIRLPENFLSPYLAQTPSEFWQRWHITLSRWIKDYLFTPLALGLGRASGYGLFLAASLTMLVAGLWHGAGWNYALFGLYHGLLLVLERRLKVPAYLSPASRPRAAARAMVMFILVLVGWLVFRSGDLPMMGRFVTGVLFDSGSHEIPASGLSVYAGLAFCFVAQAAGYFDLRSERWVVLEALESKAERWRAWVDAPALLDPLVGACAGLALAGVFMGALFLRPHFARAFIYFQF